MISACLSLFKSLCPHNLWLGRTVAVGNLMPIVKCRWCPFFTSVTPWRTKRPGPCPARTHTRSSPADSNVSNSSCPVPSVPWLTCRFESKDDLLRIIQKLEFIMNRKISFIQSTRRLVWCFLMLKARFKHGKRPEWSLTKVFSNCITLPCLILRLVGMSQIQYSIVSSSVSDLILGFVSCSCFYYLKVLKSCLV